MLRVFAAQDAQAGAGGGGEKQALAASLEGVLTVAEERKVLVGHPVEQRLAFTAYEWIGAFRPPLEQIACFAHAIPHLAPVTHRNAHVGQNLGDLVAQAVQRLWVGFARDCEADK